MPASTSIDEVEQAVTAVQQMQQQIADLVGAVKLLTARVEALEARSAGRRRKPGASGG